MSEKKDFIKEFQNKIPIISYDDIETYIEKEKNAEKNTLLADEIRLFELTSGSTSNTKYIPYTQAFLKQYMAAVYTWLYDLYENNSKLYKGTVYWSISPLLKRETFTNGGIRVGIEDDSSYFNKFSAYILNKIFTVPKEVKNIENMNDFLYITSIFLLLSEDLVMISIWSPTFLLVLIDFIEKNRENIIKLLKNNYLACDFFLDKNITNKEYFIKIQKKYQKLWKEKRIDFLKQNLFEGKINYSNIWEKLKLISCWTDSNSYDLYLQLKKKFPSVNFQGKGLLSTESIVSFPLNRIKNGSLVAYSSFFYEFLDFETQEIKLLHELEKNKKYIVIITTNAGLYRYNTNDIVEVVDFYKTLAVIKFYGRSSKYSDIVGEKLESNFVEKQIKRLMQENNIKSNFLLLAPTRTKNSGKEKIFYTLFLEEKRASDKEKIKSLEDTLNKYLCEAYHYAYAFELRQLEKAKIFLIEENTGLNTYMEEKNRFQRFGDIKIQTLDNKYNWEKKFKGGYI